MTAQKWIKAFQTDQEMEELAQPPAPGSNDHPLITVWPDCYVHKAWTYLVQYTIYPLSAFLKLPLKF